MKGKVKVLGIAIGYGFVGLMSQIVVGGLLGFIIAFVIGFKDGFAGNPTDPIAIQAETLEVFAQLVTPMLIATSIMTLIGIWCILLIRGKKMKNACQLFPVNIKDIALAIGLGLTVWCFDIALVYGISQVDFMQTFYEAYEQLSISLGSQNIWLGLLVIGILAPIAEEMLFRGAIQNTLREHFSVVTAIILQALFFAIFHMNVVQGIYTFIMGLILGYIAYKLKSIYPAIIMHCINNIIALLGGSVLEQVDEGIATLILVSIGIIGSGILLFIVSKINKKDYQKMINIEEAEEIIQSS